MSTKPKPVDPAAGPCFKCKAPCGDAEYCYGCKQHICEKCDVSAGGLMGNHRPSEHLVPYED